MNIGFDAKRYFHNNSGLGNYSRDLVKGLIQKYPENTYLLFDKRPQFIQETNIVKNIAPKYFGLFWRTRGITKQIAIEKIDVFHGLSNELPYGKWPKNTKKVVTIHDLIFHSHPKFYYLFDRLIYHLKTKHAIKIADRIIATSEATKDDIKKYYNVSENKIEVIYQTCANNHWKNYSQDEIIKYKEKANLPDKFILYVSSFQRRKNHLQVLKGLKHLKNLSINIVFAGRMGETYQNCVDFVNKNHLRDQVFLKPDIDPLELPFLYRAAAAFIYPSVIEGFGIPLIEASCASLPIATNDISVFSELSPPNSIRFDANNIKHVAQALVKLDGMSRTDYTEYLQKFSPDILSEKLMCIYKS